MSDQDPVSLRGELQSLIGSDSVLTHADDMAPLMTDHRRLYQGRALAVALPRTVEEVSRVVGWCNQRRIGLVPQGGNTGYCGGATPDESGEQLVLLLRRLNRIRAIDPQNFSMTAEAGCVLAHLQQAADAVDRFFPLSLGSEGSCQIGGNLATNAGGLNVVRYGMTRELVLGIEAVLPDGQILSNLKSLRKDNTGYNLKSLLVGSEGTLAVITAATLKLWPKMRSSATAFIAIPKPENAIALLGTLRAGAGESLSSFELIPRIAVELTMRYIEGVSDPFPASYPWYLLCELTSAGAEPLPEHLEQILSDAAERGELLDAALATSERVRAAFWKLRETVPEAQRHFGPSLKHDVSVPVASLPRFIDEASAWVRAHVPDGVLVCYGHVGDGNLHFNVNRAEGAETAAFLAREPDIKRAIHDLVARYEGSFSAEHGIGRLKREELQRYSSSAALSAMRAIKQSLDPNGIMNPGKLL
ncbi:MAG TPA: FAD-binding oxidoreductase [Steroidobacteraceae bacterium]|jgi:FAD/FMN-containing dehydrogenase|nr:FAD-binding oxidoreductase [Steroidobacteraceae bacterium]